MIERLKWSFRAPRLTTVRIAAAFVVALAADGLQIALIALGPAGWVGVVQIIDVVAMGMTCWLLGFHLLLLPTFVVEFIPVVDMLPTWLGCVAMVVALRKKEQRTQSQPGPGRTTVVAPPRLPDAR